MLEMFKKYMNGEDKPGIEAKAKDEVAMDIKTESVAELTSQMQQAVQMLQDKDVKLADLASQLSSATSLADQLKAEVAELNKQKLEAVTKQRKEKLIAIVGTVKAEEQFETLNKLDDTTFNSVISMFTVASSLEEKSFAEKGVDVEADVNAPVKSIEQKMLEQKYAQKQ